VSAAPQRTLAPTAGRSKARRAGRQHHDDRRPEQERPELVAGLDRRGDRLATVRAGPAPRPGVVADVGQPDVADAGGGDHRDRDRPPRRRHLDDHPLVDREQAVDALDEGRADGPAQAGDVVVRGDAPAHRRVDAVVVAGRQVDRRELPALERGRQLAIDHQILEPVVDALGLDQRAGGDRAGGADRAIGRRDHRRGGDRAGSVDQRPGEEVAEAREARQRRADLVEPGPHRRGERADDARVRRFRRPAQGADGHAVAKLGEGHAEAQPWVDRRAHARNGPIVQETLEL
jgi:hypothetical protein